MISAVDSGTDTSLGGGVPSCLRPERCCGWGCAGAAPLGVGINIIRYRQWSHLDLIAKPGVAAYWRYNHNWSFGLTLEWWLDFQYVDPSFQDVSQARMGNFLAIAPSMIYNF